MADKAVGENARTYATLTAKELFSTPMVRWASGQVGSGQVGRWAGGQMSGWVGGQMGRWADKQVGL